MPSVLVMVRRGLAAACLLLGLGWPAADGALAGREQSLAGGYMPVARTRADREATGDPRPSLEERYPTRAAYYEQAVRAADALVRERLLLPRDAVRLLR